MTLVYSLKLVLARNNFKLCQTPWRWGFFFSPLCRRKSLKYIPSSLLWFGLSYSRDQTWQHELPRDREENNKNKKWFCSRVRFFPAISYSWSIIPSGTVCVLHLGLRDYFHLLFSFLFFSSPPIWTRTAPDSRTEQEIRKRCRKHPDSLFIHRWTKHRARNFSDADSGKMWCAGACSDALQLTIISLRLSEVIKPEGFFKMWFKM